MKYTHKINIIFSFMIALVVSIVACKRTASDSEFLGDRIVAAPEGFEVIGGDFTGNPDPAYFTLGNVTYKAVLSHEVTWKITIRGQVSGAVKEISKTSIVIDEPWNGNASNGFFFRKDEKAVAELTFLGSDLVLRDTVLIKSTIKYDQQTINGITYNLIDDFDGNGTPMKSPGKDLFDGDVIMQSDSVLKVQGLYAFNMSGVDLSKNGWCGGVNHTNLTELKEANRCPQTENPEELYANVYVYGTGQPNTSIEIKLYEVDDEVKFEQINKPGGYVYEQNVNDAWLVQIPITWTGWKLVSRKYSSFTSAKDPLAGGNGNKLKEPNRITGMAISLLSLPDPGGSPAVYIDYVTLTEGGLFTP